MATITITSAEMANRISTIGGTIPVTIRYRTDADFRKNGTIIVDDQPVPVVNPFYGQTTKIAEIQCFMGSWNYENAVNARRKKEYQQALMADENAPAPEPFVARPRKWGERVTGTPWVRHAGNNRHSVELSVTRCLSVTYLDNEGNVIPEDFFRPFKKVTPEGARQELENPVILRDLKPENIISVKYAGDTVIVEELAEYGPAVSV